MKEIEEGANPSSHTKLSSATAYTNISTISIQKYMNKHTTISKKWMQMKDVYLRFAKDWPDLDRSESAALQMYSFESKGITIPNPYTNAYFVGKKYMDVTVAMWKEDIEAGLLRVSELLDDGYSEKFLTRIGLL